MTINDTRFSRNARNITVFLHALKIEPNTKGTLKTQVQLELPEHVDLEFFREAHRLNDEGTLKLYSEFKLLIIESETGEQRRINFSSRGSKTKDYLLCEYTGRSVDQVERALSSLLGAGHLVHSSEGYMLYGACSPVGYAIVSRHIPLAIRHEVFERDGFECTYCGSDEDLTLDHLHPWSRGGSHAIENLVVACRSCNSRKNAKTPSEWFGGVN